MAPMGLGLGWHQQAEVGGKGEAAMAQTQRGSIAKGAREAGETAQLVWHLLHERGGWGLTPQHPHRCPAGMAAACDPSIPGKPTTLGD